MCRIKERKIINCGYCDDKFEVPNYKYKNLIQGKINNLFCSKNCLQNWQKINFKGEKSVKFNSIEKQCFNCGDSYLTPKSRESSSKFCSNVCRDSYRTKDIKLHCEYCNREFTKKPAQIKNKNFCCKKCLCDWNSKINNKQIHKQCLVCNNNYKIPNNQKDRNNVCSKKCNKVWLKEIYFKSPQGQEHLRKNGIISTQKKSYKDTKPERMVKDFLIQNSVEHVSQHIMYDKFIVDFYLPDKNIVIEVLGDYWHANPDKYGDGESKKPLTEKQIKQKNKDRARHAYLTKCGHKVHMIWEKDIYEDIEKSMSFLFD